MLRLTPKAFQLLELLVAEHPKAISQKTIQDSLWPDTFVDDGSLHNLIYQLRQMLDDERRDVIKTVYGYGFSFGAPVVSEDALEACACELSIGDEDFRLREGENIIGREWDAAVRIDAPSISRRHARIVVEGSRAMIEDLGSKNGTFVGAKRLRAPRQLSSGDQILFGSVAAKFRILSTPPSTETAHEH